MIYSDKFLLVDDAAVVVPVSATPLLHGFSTSSPDWTIRQHRLVPLCESKSEVLALSKNIFHWQQECWAI